MMIRLIPYAALAIVFSVGAIAATNSAQDAWSAEAMSEPCMNGDVPANGLWDSHPEQDAQASLSRPAA